MYALLDDARLLHRADDPVEWRAEAGLRAHSRELCA